MKGPRLSEMKCVDAEIERLERLRAQFAGKAYTAA